MEDQEIIDKLLERPETYRSLLGECYGRNTETVIIRRRILRNIKDGSIGRVYLNGTRGGETLFYHPNKKYSIVILSKHRDFKYYYCLNTKKLNSSIVLLIDVNELVDCVWKKCNDIEAFIGNVIKVI